MDGAFGCTTAGLVDGFAGALRFWARGSGGSFMRESSGQSIMRSDFG
jgi:hypothetical protein